MGAAFTAVLLSAASSYAITVTGNANAVIRRNIAATEIQIMNFGTINSGATAGIVTLSPAGVRTSALSYFSIKILVLIL